MSNVQVTRRDTVIYTIEVGADTAAKLEALLGATQRFTDEGNDLHPDLEDLFLSLTGEYSTEIVDGRVVLSKESV